MLQRIQSVYLFLIVILMVSATYLPLIYFVGAGSGLVILEAMGFWTGDVYAPHTWGILSLGVLSAIISFITIFFYKNRNKQILLCKINAAFIIAFYLTVSVYVYSVRGEYNFVLESVQFGLVFPFIALILDFLAYTRIKKDEKLVRSLDRIR